MLGVKRLAELHYFVVLCDIALVFVDLGDLVWELLFELLDIVEWFTVVQQTYDVPGGLRPLILQAGIKVLDLDLVIMVVAEEGEGVGEACPVACQVNHEAT